VVGYVVDRAGARTDAQALEVGEESVRTRALTPAVREVVRVVPHHQTYPVRAEYQAPDGTLLQISLQLLEGKLSHLAIDFADETHYEDESAIDVVEELIDQWPAPADLRYLREGPDGRPFPLT
jgi:hypothetical protein